MFNVTYTPIIVIFENEIHCPKTMSQTCLQLPKGAFHKNHSKITNAPWLFCGLRLNSTVYESS